MPKKNPDPSLKVSGWGGNNRVLVGKINRRQPLCEVTGGSATGGGSQGVSRDYKGSGSVSWGWKGG